MDIQTSLGVGVFLSIALQWLKSKPWFPWITTETEKLNKYTTIVIAGLAQIGIHLACSSADRTCTFSWPEPATLPVSIWHVASNWFVQWAMIHGYYKATK